jgi:hypothetical protein
MSGTYSGGCHCGAIGWEYRTDIDPDQWIVRSCQCSFCRTHGTRCTSDPAGRVDIRGHASGNLVRYRFGLGTADFLVCGKCGVYIGAMVESPDGAFATLNLNALESPVGVQWDAVPVSYDDEGSEGRVARRVERWTPVSSVT